MNMSVKVQNNLRSEIMLNPKEIELSNKLFEKLQLKFPTIRLVEIIENPHEKDGVWMRIIPPTDSKESIAISEFAAEMTTDIIVEHNCNITISFAR